MTNPIRVEEVAVPVFVTQEAHQIAQQFAQQQPNQAKAQQVQLNTLAICAVNNYLKILGIPSNPSHCDSWNRFMRMTTNVADLELTGLGRIECRPILQLNEAEPVCYIPTEAQRERIAYVVVQVDSNQQQVLILGFVNQVEGEELPLSLLRPMSELPEYLEQYEQLSASDRVTRLTSWLRGQIDTAWQTLDEVLGVTSPNYQWRSIPPDNEAPSVPTQAHIVRGKILNLTTAHKTKTIVLLADLKSKSETDLGIELKVLPSSEETFLPAGLVMTVLDAAGDPVMQAQARNYNRMIDLGFHAEVGDRFTLRLEFEDVTIDEVFVV